MAAERTVQALEVASVARAIGAHAIAHGSTGAGNDQVRVDSILKAVAPKLDILTPIREPGATRDEEVAYIREKGFAVEETERCFSVNRGMWGTTYGNRALQNEKDGAAFDALWSSRMDVDLSRFADCRPTFWRLSKTRSRGWKRVKCGAACLAGQP